MRRAKIYAGTSGWHYGHWAGPFYPEDMRPAEFLSFYARKFRSVEINNSFYRLPRREMLSEWRTATPDDFIFACKASRYITHMKKLRDPAQSARRFFEAITALGEKLGPILFQLPPHWRFDSERLKEFLAGLPQGFRYAFEFRDESWFAPEACDLLSQNNAAFCVYDLDGRQSPIEITADFAYVRLHGPNGPYRGQYDDKTLSGWAKRMLAWQASGLDVYCYFDNDEAGYAAKDALRLLAKVAEARSAEQPRKRKAAGPAPAAPR
jgi:uncharacterized protein YecE (DUF72 family)